ncbi:MAG: glycogen debranching protein GlgX [Treponema sp.]|nr:glycogen debranching protein GlgX [Treponema sp.]
MNEIRTFDGKPLPLGASLTHRGVNFSVFSRNASCIVLNIYASQDDREPLKSFTLDPEINRTGDIWHIEVEGVSKGALYLYQADGPFEVHNGLRFDKNQLLMDPCAKALTAVSVFSNLPKNYKPPVDESDVKHCAFSRDSNFPKCVVIDDNDFDWEGDRPINRPLSESVIYETHLKGFTAGKNSGVTKPGTYAGFVEKIPYLKYLGVNAVELLPVFEFDENENSNLNPRTGGKLKNYWGYSTVNFFSPKAGYAFDKTPGACVNEFKSLVKALHKEGIEVILDVVFNHTAEGNEHGVALNFRGLENSVYYSLVPSHKEYYMNFSGCGNTFNCNQPVVREFILKCLRYWVLEYHIDGFRFDLASILTRAEDGSVLGNAPLTLLISEDPVLRNTKIIAEPWDAGGAYQLGCFPGNRWAEWNDRFRDDIRRFWRGDEHVSTGAATRIAGSSDLFASQGKKPYHSINYVTCHDGFTMNDLVSYNGKHNEENGEGNRDGTDSNWSWNMGFEGATANPLIERARNRQIRNFILTLLISQGTPMLLAGDEFRRGQQGNNNAYCQDNDMSWIDWSNADLNNQLVWFTKQAIELRKVHPVFRRENFFDGSKNEIQWFDRDGTNPDWNKISHFLAFKICGSSFKKDDGTFDEDFYVAANTDRRDVMVNLPSLGDERKWHLVADTSDEKRPLVERGKAELLRAQERYIVPAGSLIILMAK